MMHVNAKENASPTAQYALKSVGRGTGSSVVMKNGGSRELFAGGVKSQYGDTGAGTKAYHLTNRSLNRGRR